MKKTKLIIADKKVKYRCDKCKDKMGAVICPCEVAPKYDADYEEWNNK